MGTEAEKEPVEVISPDETQDTGAVETPNPEEQDQEIEIVRAGEDGSQPVKHPGFKKRVDKLRSEVNQAKQEAQEAGGELATANERIRLLELALKANEGTSPQAPTPPNPDEFNEGAADPQYVAALDEYINRKVDTGLSRFKSEQPKPAAPVDESLYQRQNGHYDKAEKLGAKDYAEVEDKAIEALGKHAVNQIIKTTDKSPEMLYYLGKNQHVAEEIAELLKSDPVTGVWKLAQLDKDLEVRPRAKQNQVPDPDTPLDGGGAVSMDTASKKLDKLREEASATGDMSKLMAYKRKLRDQGAAS